MSTTTTTTETKSLPFFTAAQVAEHNSPDDVRIIIHGQVYDVTKYLHDHPGGAEVLKEAAGTDATEAYENAGHSDDALEIMDEFRVGYLEGYQKPAPKRPRPATAPSEPPITAPASVPRSPPSKTASTVLTTIGSVAALSTAAAYYYFSRSPTSSTFLSPTKLTKSLFFPQPTTGSNFSLFSSLLLPLSLSGVTTLVILQRLLSRFIEFPHGFSRFPSHRTATPSVPTQPEPTAAVFLDPARYQSLPLVEKSLVAPSVFRFVLALPTPSTTLGLPIGQHVAINGLVGSTGQSVTRSYTPVSNDSDKGRLELLIKCYPDGKLTGGYLAGLQAGKDSVLVRGPKGPMKYRRGLSKKIGMIAGGTGITPMYQVLRAIVEDDEDNETEVSLVYASKGEEDILLREELDGFVKKAGGRVRVWYLVDRITSSVEGGKNWEYGTGHVNKAVLAEKMPSSDKENKVFLCGPPGMVDACKGMLKELGWEMPGASAKMQDQVFVF